MVPEREGLSFEEAERSLVWSLTLMTSTGQVKAPEVRPAVKPLQACRPMRLLGATPDRPELSQAEMCWRKVGGMRRQKADW